MKKTILITQYGVARISRNSNIEAIYTDQLEACLGIALVHENTIQMIHCDTIVDVTKVAETFKDFPRPYELIIAYNNNTHASFPLLNNGNFLSKESFVQRLKTTLSKTNLPLWEKATFVPTVTQAFGINFTHEAFFNFEGMELMRAPDSNARSSINMLRSYTESPKELLRPIQLDLQYTDKGWQPMPTINHVTQKLCTYFASVNYDLNKMREYLYSDKELAPCANVISTKILSNKEGVKQLRSIIDYSTAREKQKNTLTPLWSGEAQKRETPACHARETELKIKELTASGADCFKQKNYNFALDLFQRSYDYAQLIYTQNNKELAVANHNLGATYHELHMANSSGADFLEKAKMHLNLAYTIHIKNKDTVLAEKSMKRLSEMKSILEQGSQAQPFTLKK